jgi:hypothetical protein
MPRFVLLLYSGNFLIFQQSKKPYYRSFLVHMASFVDVLRPEKFSGAHFKRWSTKVTVWLTAMEVLWVKSSLPEGDISDEDRIKFQKANDIFGSCA